MNKDEIKELLAFYRKDFKIRTGMALSAGVKSWCKDTYTIKKFPSDKILSCAALYFQKSKEEILAKTRKPEIVEIRWLISAFMDEKKLSSYEIGALLRQERTNLTNTLKNFKANYKLNKEFRQEYDEFKAFMLSLTKERIKNID